MNALVYGNLTKDKNTIGNTTYEGPGGSSYFVAKTLQRLGCRPTVVSPYGKDFPIDSISGISIIPSLPTGEYTLGFENTYIGTTRKQCISSIENSANIRLSSIPYMLLSNIPLLFLCSVLPNFHLVNIEELRERKKTISTSVLIGQGFFRRIGEDRYIKPGDGNGIHTFFPVTDIIVLSENDGVNLREYAREWSIEGPIVVITQAEKGCTVFEKGESFPSVAFPSADIKDTTGAGDIFAAAFGYAYEKKMGTMYAARFANAASSLFLSSRVTKKEVTIDTIKQLMQG